MEPEIHVETVSEMEKQMHVTETEILSAVNYDDIGPHDSMSNITKNKTTASKSSSTTSSARIRALAEKAALMEQVSALQRKHEMEHEQDELNMQKEQLRRKQEKLEMETKLAAANARAHVLETMGSSSSSRVSHRANPDLENPNTSKAQYITPLTQYSLSRENVQTENVQVVKEVKNVDVQCHGYVGQTTPSAGDISKLLQRQNEITALLVKQNLYSTLPPRDIPIFDGDPMQYEMFIRAFEGGVEKKTDNFSDCLHFINTEEVIL